MSTWDELTWPGASEKASAAELEALQLAGLKENLAGVRRLLVRAVRVGWRSRGDVRALADLAADVHRDVLRELERARGAR